jgi:hypothetical protein
MRHIPIYPQCLPNHQTDKKGVTIERPQTKSGLTNPRIQNNGWTENGSVLVNIHYCHEHVDIQHRSPQTSFFKEMKSPTPCQKKRNHPPLEHFIPKIVTNRMVPPNSMKPVLVTGIKFMYAELCSWDDGKLFSGTLIWQ